jgi:peptide/nickel transport system substrate-binding protein
VYETVILRAIESRRERERQFEAGEIDILANVPPTTACSVNNYADFEGCNDVDTQGWDIKSIPSLEVSFIMFNFENEILSDLSARKAIAMVLNKNDFVDFAFGYAKPSLQFISSGVFGFNPKIEMIEYNISEAKRLIKNKQTGSFERLSLTLAYPAGLDAIGKYVESQLAEINIDVQSKELSAVEFAESLKKADADMYFLGWKSELGDALDFLEGVAHSRDAEQGFGSYNAINYRNTEVDGLIEEIVENLDEKSRLEQMQRVMQIITENDIIGVPLFESETIFAIKKGVDLQIRIDGYIHAKDVK